MLPSWPGSRATSRRTPLAACGVKERSARDFDADHDVALLDGVYDVLPFRHLAEHRVLAVQVRLRRVRDEELAAVRVRAGVGHRDHAALVLERIALALVGELVAGAAAAGAGRVARLDHEVVDDAVKLHAVVEALTGEKYEIVDGLRCVLRVELELDRAAVGF